MPREPLVRGALEDAAIQQTDQLLDGVWRGGGGPFMAVSMCRCLKKIRIYPFDKG